MWLKSQVKPSVKMVGCPLSLLCVCPQSLLIRSALKPCLCPLQPSVWVWCSEKEITIGDFYFALQLDREVIICNIVPLLPLNSENFLQSHWKVACLKGNCWLYSPTPHVRRQAPPGPTLINMAGHWAVQAQSFSGLPLLVLRTALSSPTQRQWLSEVTLV